MSCQDNSRPFDNDDLVRRLSLASDVQPLFVPETSDPEPLADGIGPETLMRAQIFA